jgi:hypothetical protein
MLRDHLGHAGTDGKIILKWILQKQNVNTWTEFNMIRFSGRFF